MSDTEAPEKSASAIGRRVKALRLRRGWNQADLARRIGENVQNSYVNHLENGRIQDPTSKRLTKIAEALGVDLMDLTEGRDPDQPDLSKTLKRLAPESRALVGDLVSAVVALPPHARSAALASTLASLKLQAQLAAPVPAPAPDPDAAPEGWSFRAYLAPHLTPDLLDEAEAAYGHWPYRDAKPAADLLIRLANEIKAENTLRPADSAHAS